MIMANPRLASSYTRCAINGSRHSDGRMSGNSGAIADKSFIMAASSMTPPMSGYGDDGYGSREHDAYYAAIRTDEGRLIRCIDGMCGCIAWCYVT